MAEVTPDKAIKEYLGVAVRAVQQAEERAARLMAAIPDSDLTEEHVLPEEEEHGHQQ